MKRSRRSVHYPEQKSRYYLTRTIFRETIAALNYYAQFHSEGLVYWGGAVGATSEITVTSLLKLNHTPQGGTVRPSKEEMRALIRTLSRRDEKLIAQIHTHPYEAFHSFGDSQHATSYHMGFLSIVLPNYGANVTSLHDCAVYEFRDDFGLLTAEEIEERFIVQDTIIDLMPPSLQPEQYTAESTGEAIWNALRRKVKSIVFRKR